MLGSKSGGEVPRMRSALVVSVLTDLLLEEVDTYLKHSRITGHAALRFQGVAVAPRFRRWRVVFQSSRATRGGGDAISG